MRSKIIEWINKNHEPFIVIGNDIYCQKVSEASLQITGILEFEHTEEYRNDLMRLTQDQIYWILIENMKNNLLAYNPN